MTEFDASQQRVLELDAARHARVLGAPGTGKTTVLVEAFVAATRQPGYQDGQVLVFAPSRLVATALRGQIEGKVNRALGGTAVRTVTSFAFAVLQRQAALKGLAAPRLLTGTAQDEVASQVIDQLVQQTLQTQHELPFTDEVMQSEAFRGELRELQRVLDDAGCSANDLVTKLHLVRSRRKAGRSLPDDANPGLVETWSGALAILDLVRHRLMTDRPGELSASALVRSAREVLRESDELALPKLVLVDDAAEIGEGALALLSELANRGAMIWAFGDPDTATAVFQGERARVLAGLHAELARRGANRSAIIGEEQLVVLEQVHRYPAKLRALVGSLTGRIGAAGVGQQRRATAASEAGDDHSQRARDSSVQFATVATPAEQIGVLAHRMRARRLGLGGRTALAWSDMAVVCRTRNEVSRVSRLLAANQVPTNVAAGGVVLREHQLVRELIRLLQHSLGISQLSPREVNDLLGGVVGGVDPIALRRLRSALRTDELRAAETEERDAASVDEVMYEAFQLAGRHPIIDTASARRLRDLGSLAAAGATAHAAGATPREVLWQLWHGSSLPDSLQAQALEGRGARSDDAHRMLDAVLGLFFALQRHEEQDNDRPIALLLDDLAHHAVPEDTLAAQSEREVVTVGTAQSMLSREFELVCVTGVQDGSWPNLRTRGSLFGVTALERWLRGEAAEPPSRKDTLHDELRLFVQAVSRARTEVFVVAVSNEEAQPSPFFALGRQHLVVGELPSNRLTLRGAVAEMRRRVVNDPSDDEALKSLVKLEQAGVPGAHPDEWYGVVQPSTQAPLHDIDHDLNAVVAVSPSQLERAEECPLNWVISRLGASRTDYRAKIGTLIHHALETCEAPVTAEQIIEKVSNEWKLLKFDAQWQETRAKEDVAAMSRALADYLRDFECSESTLIATEASFEVPIGFAKLRGFADRLEARRRPDGTLEVTVVDLKTGMKKPTARELEQHAQLLSYQLGVLSAAFNDADGKPVTATSTGAKLVYVHPGALTKTQEKKGQTYVEISQQGLETDAQKDFEQRVTDAAKVMAAGTFVAQVEHHCENPNTPNKSCALHIIPAVSFA